MQFRILKNLVFLTPAFFLFGCGIWSDFTTYFNLYYNTSDTFQQAEEAINSQKLNLFATTELNIPGSASQLLDKVIEKSSVILQFHSETAYVDDALLILGKAFYYKKNYQKGLRKFQELIATQPESDLILETQLWIGKSYLKLKNYDEALEIFDAVRKEGIEQGEEEIVTDAYIEEIKYRLIQEDYPGAISLSKELVDVSTDEEINAEVSYEIGKLYMKLDDPENAALAFQQVFDYSPGFEIEFEAQLELGRAYRESGQERQALEIFNELKSEQKYVDYYNRIDLEIGITQIELENYNEAISYLSVVDTGYSASQSTGIARYKLGELYQYTYNNYDSASYYYSKVVSSPAPQDYLISANEKIQRFKKYENLKSGIKERNKQLEYIINPESFVKDSIEFYSDTVETANKTDELNRTENMLNPTEERSRERSRMLQSSSVKKNIPAEKKGKPPVRPNISADSVKSILTKNYFELGNLFFTEFDLLDSAGYYYNKVLTDFPESDYKARTMYALASYYQSKNNNSRADSLYNEIYENYKNESVVNAAADKINKPLIDLHYDPAIELYTAAEDKLKEDYYDESLQILDSIYNNYPQSSLAPKAMYTTGWILENQMQNYDSAAVVYDSIVTKYPQSTYALKIRPKINYYKQEKERIKKAYEDSIKQQALNDSLKTDSLNLDKNLPEIAETDSLNNNREKIKENVTAKPDKLIEEKNDLRRSERESVKKEKSEIPPEVIKEEVSRPDTIKTRRKRQRLQ